MTCLQSVIILSCVFAILINAQGFGMDANMMGGNTGSGPMGMAQEAAALYARGFNSDQIDDILAEPPHLRAMEAARQSSFVSAMLGEAAGNSAVGAISTSAGSRAHVGSVAPGGAARTGLGIFGAGGATGGADAAILAAGIMNRIGSGSPFVQGISANLVADMMAGHMHIAQETAALYARGFNPDQIDDILAEPPHLRPMEAARQTAQSAIFH